jgi:CubicO group peptidase (beta-lactamase class C family)
MLRALTLSALLSLSLGAMAAADTAHDDPAERFAMTFIGDWTPTEAGGPWFRYADLPLFLAALAVDGATPAAALDQGLRKLGIDPDGLQEVAQADWNRWRIHSLDAGDDQGVTALVQDRDGWSLLIVGRGPGDLVFNPPQDVLASLETVRFPGEDGLPETIEAFERFVAEAMAAGPPGLSIVLAGPGEVVYARGFGLAHGPVGRRASPETIYQWGSITKTVTATAILQLVERGLIDLDAPVSDYLDYVPADPPVTARHLLMHRSGLPEDPDAIFRLLRLNDEPPAEIDGVLRAYFAGMDERLFPPGTMTAYVNPNYLLLGDLVAVRSGVAFEDYVRASILGPLGMHGTDFGLIDVGMRSAAAASAVSADQMQALVDLIDAAQGPGRGDAFIEEADEDTAWLAHFVIEQGGAGGLVGPATDLARYGRMLLNGGTLDGVRILSPESVALLLAPQIGPDGTLGEIGLAWHFGGEAPHPFVEHDGGGPGIQAKLRLYPDDGLAVAVMANGAGVDRNAVADTAAHVFFTLGAR